MALTFGPIKTNVKLKTCESRLLLFFLNGLLVVSVYMCICSMFASVCVRAGDSFCGWSGAHLSSIVPALGWLVRLPPPTQWEREFSGAIGTIDDSCVYILPS